MPSTQSRQKLLYHYTSAESLLGIVQTGSLWATDIRFLNDTAEFGFARDELLRELLGRTDRLRNERVRLLIRKQLAAMQAIAPPAYVISLSERGNALSQWRAYAPRDGVSIGFHFSALRDIRGFALHRCKYLKKKEEVRTKKSHRVLRAIVDEIYRPVQELARLIQQEVRKKGLTDSSILLAQSDNFSLVDVIFVWAALTVKHDGFSEEMEWRLIDNMGIHLVHELGDDPEELIRFRRGAFGVTPYLVATLPKSWKGAPLGIAKVIVGPSSNSESTVASIRDLLRIKLRSSATVESCQIPFRAW